MRAGAALVPNPWGQRDPVGLGVPRDTTLGCPLCQEGLAEVAGEAGHRCHCPTDRKEGLTPSLLSASPGGARAKPPPCSPCKGRVRKPVKY